MMSKKPYFLIVGLLIFAIIMVACGAETEEATEVPAVEEPAEEPSVEEPAEEPAEEVMEFVGDILAAENCDYGGKILSVAAVDEFTVEITLCKTDPAFLSKLAFTPFAVQPAEWLEETGGTGELLRHPIGTGPYKIEEWVQGSQVIYKRFDDYWGEPAPAETAVLRWSTEAAACRLHHQCRHR
jgi:ABC-type transport system substrate-binding protein